MSFSGRTTDTRTTGDVLGVLRRQEHAAAVLLHVRPELKQSLSFLYVTGRWIRSQLVSGQSCRGVRRNRQSPCGTNQCVGPTTRMVADSTGVRSGIVLSGGLQLPGRLRRHAVAGDACVSEAARHDRSFLGNRVDVESSRHGVAVLEPHGLYARRPTRYSDAATAVQVRVPGDTLLEQVIRAVPRR